MICPICKIEVYNMYKHLNQNNDINHNNLFKNQTELIIDLFNDLTFTNKCNIKDFNVFFPYSRCLKIWQEHYGKELCKNRANKLNGINVSKSLKGVPKTEMHKKHLSKSHIGQIAWNKGLTAKDDNRVNQYTEKRNKTMSNILKKKYESGEMSCWLKGKNKQDNPELIEMYNKVSETMSNKLQHNSRGIAGIRKDIGHFAASTYEANIYRIFQYEKKQYKKEYDCIFKLKLEDGSIKNYRIDILDVDGLFGFKNCYIEVKGYMDEQSERKIKLFREQYPDLKLIVISDDERHSIKPDIKYSELEGYYINKIPLWETKNKNLKKYPDLYNENWISGKRENKRVFPKLLKLNNDFNLKIGFLWKHQQFNQRPTYNGKFIKEFKVYHNNNEIIYDENWGSVLSKTIQHIKSNAMDFYNNYDKLIIKGYCKSENIELDIVQFDILENKWFL